MARQEIQLDVQSLLRRTPAAGKAQLCTRLVDEVLVRTRLALQESKPIFSHLGQPVVRRETHDLRPWWFLGDIHGDYFALHTLLQHVYSQDPDANVCFLGDVVDRGLDSAECILLILMLGLERPGKTIWIAGNHDEAVSVNAAGQFASSVIPAEFPEWLNSESHWTKESRERLGRLFIDVVARLPRAVLFADGLLAVHGGVPLKDRLPSIHSFDDLQSPENQQDFVWTRCADTKFKHVNRGSKGCSYGSEDVASFARHVHAYFPVQRIVRGHDHPERGQEAPKLYQHTPLLTVNTFAFDYIVANPLESSGYRTDLVMAKQVFGSLPTIVPVAWSWHHRVPFEKQRLVDRIAHRRAHGADESDSRRWHQQTAIQCRNLAEVLSREEVCSQGALGRERRMDGAAWRLASKRQESLARAGQTPAGGDGLSQPPIVRFDQPNRLDFLCCVREGELRSRIQQLVELRDKLEQTLQLPTHMRIAAGRSTDLGLTPGTQLPATSVELYADGALVAEVEWRETALALQRRGRSSAQRLLSILELVGIVRDELLPPPVHGVLRRSVVLRPLVNRTGNFRYQISSDWEWPNFFISLLKRRLAMRLMNGLPPKSQGDIAPWCMDVARDCLTLSRMLRCHGEVVDSPHMERWMEMRADAALWEEEGEYWHRLGSRDLDELYALMHEAEAERAKLKQRRLPPSVALVECRARGISELPLWCIRFMDAFSLILRDQLRCEVRVSYAIDLPSNGVDNWDNKFELLVSTSHGDAATFELSQTQLVLKASDALGVDTAYVWLGGSLINQEAIKKACRAFSDQMEYSSPTGTTRMVR